MRGCSVRRRSGIGDATDRRLAEYFETQPAVLFALVFGSVARGEARPDSDLDIAVMLDAPERDEPAGPVLVRSTLTAELMSACRRNDVDVLILNSATPLLQHRVLRDGDVVYCRDLSALSQFTVRAMQRYVDTKRLRELQRERLARLLEPAPVHHVLIHHVDDFLTFARHVEGFLQRHQP